jgi:hypothetical protein
MGPKTIRIDVRVAGAEASCCGVNLAFAVFGLAFFPQAVKPCRFRAPTSLKHFRRFDTMISNE